MFRGIYNPCITPLQDDGRIDFEGLFAHIDNLIEAKIDGILFFGSIGEFYNFSEDEKKELISKVVPYINNRVKVLIGTGSNSLSEAIRLAKFAQDKKASGIVVVSPYYFNLSDEGAYEYFSKIAKNVTLPIMLYNFPARTNSDLSPNLVAKLAKEYKNIVALKDTVDNISHTRAVIKKVKQIREDFCVLSGFDEYYLVNRISGGDGVLSGLTNVAPKIFTKMHEAYENHDFLNTQKYATKISKLMFIYEKSDLFISAIKSAVKLNGLNINTSLKEPQIKTTKAQLDEINMILKDVLKWKNMQLK